MGSPPAGPRPGARPEYDIEGDSLLSEGTDFHSRAGQSGRRRPIFFDRFHKSIAAFASAGKNLLVEHIVELAEWLDGLIINTATHTPKENAAKVIASMSGFGNTETVFDKRYQELKFSKSKERARNSRYWNLMQIKEVAIENFDRELPAAMGFLKQGQ